MSIDVVLFDLDDTLFAHREAVDVGIVAYGRSVGLDIVDGPAEAGRWHELEEEFYHHYLTGELDFLQQRWERARAFVAPYGQRLDDAGANRWFDDYLVEYERGWTLHDDAVRVLDTLVGTRIGLITNGDLTFQTAKIRAIGLEHRVEHVVASGDFGVAKPDARIFLHACELFGVEPAAACYVGDRVHTDALGAAAAGLVGIWLDRHDVATPDDRSATAAASVPIIRTLDALPAVLSLYG